MSANLLATDSPVRVALDTTYAGVNPTGVRLYSRRLAQGLQNGAVRLRLDVKCFGPSCGKHGASNGFAGLFQEWPTYTHGILPARMLPFRPQIVHSTSHIGPLWGPGRLIVTVHDLIFMRYPRDYQACWLTLTRLLLPAVLRRAAAVIADSQATKEDIKQFFGVPDGKIVVIYPGVDATSPAAPDEAPAKLPGIKRGIPYIFCPGPLVRRKNLEVVMRAFALLAPRFEDLQIFVSGERPPGMSGPSPSELRSHVPVQFHRRMHFVGYVPTPERDALLSAASVLCYPSRYEGFGLPPIEAMARGVPVVVAATPASIEVTGGAALVAALDSPSEWAGAIEKVITRPEVAANLRYLGTERSAKFTWLRTVEQTARLYHRVHKAAGVQSPKSV
jgi:glycosyltransferase involved in cell wall biosynthesis